MKSNPFQIQVFLVFVFGATPNDLPLKYMCSIKDRLAIELGATALDAFFFIPMNGGYHHRLQMIMLRLRKIVAL